MPDRLAARYRHATSRHGPDVSDGPGGTVAWLNDMETNLRKYCLRMAGRALHPHEKV